MTPSREHFEVAIHSYHFQSITDAQATFDAIQLIVGVILTVGI